MFYITTDTGERFSTHSGFSILGAVTRFTSPTEARGEFHRSSYRAHGADPKYYIVVANKNTVTVVEEIKIFEVKR